MQQSARTISSNLTQKLGLNIKIKAIEVKSINAVKLYDVVVYDKGEKEIFNSETTTISFSILSLIKNPSFTESIAKVIIDNPKLKLQKNKDGQWNYQDLISEDKSGNEDFFGKVIVNDGMAEVDLPERKINLENINGSVNFSTIKDYDIDLSLSEASSKIEVRGNWGKKNSLNVTVDKGNIEDYIEFIPENSDFKMTSGQVSNINLNITKKNEEFYWIIDSEIENAKLEIKNKTLIWNDGNFYNGNWYYGIFKQGDFYGVWENGIWENGNFYGKWESGINLTQDIKK